MTKKKMSKYIYDKYIYANVSMSTHTIRISFRLSSKILEHVPCSISLKKYQQYVP